MNVNSEEPNDSYSKLEEAQKRYLNSEKGKTAVKRYKQSEKGKDAQQRYLQSERGQAALLRYYLSEKAQTQRQQRAALLKLFRRLDKILGLNPDKSIEDALNEIGGGPNET